MNTDEHGLNDLTGATIGCAYDVANTLGAGFLEGVYENALAHELRKRGHVVEQQHPISVMYDGIVVGEYCADLLVGSEVIIELKAVKSLDEIHIAQCMNYLRATGKPVCLLINFGSPRVQIKRIAGSRNQCSSHSSVVS
jgi:GxxExxY protein